MTSEDLTTKLANEAELEEREMTDEELEGVAGGKMPKDLTDSCDKCNAGFATPATMPYSSCPKCGGHLTLEFE